MLESKENKGASIVGFGRVQTLGEPRSHVSGPTNLMGANDPRGGVDYEIFEESR